ncbi:MAG: PH domain-containing protein [Erysipelotrichaceae bacterium]|jgi:membrane protein YdbS with pleckstrin-like domain|nr:PH domain-containing protein [Erysipelotrichia bacterium]NLZ16087.1 PH domain-containing protein [Erysipelotrichaceae bacterium]
MRIDEEYFKVENTLSKNSVDDVLMPDEMVLQRLKPNRKVLLLESIFKGLPIVLIWVIFDSIFIVAMIFAGAFEQDPWLIAIIVPFFALHLMPLWIYIAGIVRALAGYKNIEYAFTDRRIIIRSGLIGIDFKTIFYSDVEGINVKVGVFDKMFKVGDIYIKAHDQSAVLDNIEKPYFFLSKLQQITLDIKTDIQYPNGLRPKDNPGYKTKYKGEDNY